ncbi:MAG TPA: chloride channel protein [Flavobacteriales bacterium]|nr:chloride channel protein [Flavobacteriales bacterium]
MAKKITLKYERVIEYIHSRLNPLQFLLLSSFLVGLTAATAAILLKRIVFHLHDLITYNYKLQYSYIIYLLFPLIGIFLTVLIVKKVFRTKLEKGNSLIIYAIHKKSAMIDKVHMYMHVITSAITVGFGGSTGLESPIVLTGSAIGSNYARTYQISYKDRLLLIASGAAAGIGAAFNAPISGVLFAFEVILVNASVSAFIPIIIASATGAILSKIFLKEGILLNFKLKEPFNYYNIPFYIVLALLCGFVSVVYARIFTSTESYFKKLKMNAYGKALFGGILIALLCLCLPPLFGEGYASIKNLAELHPEKLLEKSIFREFFSSPWMILLFLVLVFVVKAIAVGITLGTGGNGGNFAPSLLVGAFLGFSFSYALMLFGFKDIPSNNFCLVAMAGILSGVFHAPLAAIFLIAEITGGYELFLPLMIVSALSYMISRYFDNYSMDTKKLFLQGVFKKESIDDLAIKSMHTADLIETDHATIDEGMPLTDVVNMIMRSDKNIFPVITKENKFTGIVKTDDLKKYMLDPESQADLVAADVQSAASAMVLDREPVSNVMKKFEEAEAWILPVVDEALQYKGFITRTKLYENYRNQILQIRNEVKRV